MGMLAWCFFAAITNYNKIKIVAAYHNILGVSNVQIDSSYSNFDKTK